MRLAKPIPSQPISSFCGPSDVDFLNSGNQLIDLSSGQYPIVPHVTSYLNLFLIFKELFYTILVMCFWVNVLLFMLQLLTQLYLNVNK